MSLSSAYFILLKSCFLLISLVDAVLEKRQIFFFYNTITWLLCAFSLVVDRDLLKDTQMASNPRQITSADLFFMPQKFFNKQLEFLLYKTSRLHFSVRVYCNRSQKTSQRVKNNSRATRLRLVSYFLVLYTLWRHLWSITVHTRKNVLYLLSTQQLKSRICFKTRGTGLS